MLQFIGFSTMDEFIDAVVPTNILKRDNIEIGEERTEEEVLAELKKIALKNKADYLAFGAFNSSKTKKVQYKASINIIRKVRKIKSFEKRFTKAWGNDKQTKTSCRSYGISCLFVDNR